MTYLSINDEKCRINREVLVLNRNWNAIGVTTLKRAIRILFSYYKDGSPKARIIDVENGFNQVSWCEWKETKPLDGVIGIRTVNDVFRIPEVIILSKYDEFPTQKSDFNKKSLFKRDNYKCQYCGEKYNISELTVDHIIPKSKGGKTTWTNTVSACSKCNSKKSNKTLEEANMNLLTVPKRPKPNILKSQKRESWNYFVKDNDQAFQCV